jgi:hypothetical protein
MFETPEEALDRDAAEQEAETAQLRYEDDARYLMYLDQRDLMRNRAREDAEEIRLLREVAQGGASDWAVAYAAGVQTAQDLKTCVVNLHALDYPPPFDVKALIDCWLKTDPAVHEAIAWLAQRCFSLQEDARPRNTKTRKREACVKTTAQAQS